MDPEPTRISAHADQEMAAWTMLCHRGVALAVVDDNGALLAVIPPERMLMVLLQEHEEETSPASQDYWRTAAGHAWRARNGLGYG